MLDINQVEVKKQNVKMGMEFNMSITKNTLKKKLPMWTEYTWANVDRLKRKAEKKGVSVKYYSIEQLRPKFLYLPSLIVGWGDSFHSTIDLLKQLPRDKINLIACDRCLKKLVDNEVIPDLVTNLDAGPQIRPFYKTALSEMEQNKIASALAICTDPREVQWIHGPKYWYIPAITPWGNTLTDDTIKSIGYPCVPTAGNIGTASILLSRVLGVLPPYLLGIDFGWREWNNGKTEKSPELNTLNDREHEIWPYEMVKNENGKDVPKRGPDGKKIYTWSPDGSRIHSTQVLLAYAHATRHLMLTYDLGAINIGGGVLHGPYIDTVPGADARERMTNLINHLNNWKINDELIGRRMLYLTDPKKTPISAVQPPPRTGKGNPVLQKLIDQSHAEAAKVDFNKP